MANYCQFPLTKLLYFSPLTKKLWSVLRNSRLGDLKQQLPSITVIYDRRLPGDDRCDQTMSLITSLNKRFGLSPFEFRGIRKVKEIMNFYLCSVLREQLGKIKLYTSNCYALRISICLFYCIVSNTCLFLENIKFCSSYIFISTTF